jgi:ubiquitin carboxyl-terminal hydrolase L5
MCGLGPAGHFQFLFEHLSSMVGWSTIESDPGVFTQLSHDIGIRGTQVKLKLDVHPNIPQLIRVEQVEEIVTMEDSEFARMAPVYGLIFLFKWTQEMAQAHRSAATCVENSNIYFAKQVIRV